MSNGLTRKDKSPEVKLILSNLEKILECDARIRELSRQKAAEIQFERYGLNVEDHIRKLAVPKKSIIEIPEKPRVPEEPKYAESKKIEELVANEKKSRRAYLKFIKRECRRKIIISLLVSILVLFLSSFGVVGIIVGILGALRIIWNLIVISSEKTDANQEINVDELQEEEQERVDGLNNKVKECYDLRMEKYLEEINLYTARLLEDQEAEQQFHKDESIYSYKVDNAHKLVAQYRAITLEKIAALEAEIDMKEKEQQELYNQTLHPRYHYLNAVQMFHEYFETGRTKSLGVNGGDKGAYNIYEEEYGRHAQTRAITDSTFAAGKGVANAVNKMGNSIAGRFDNVQKNINQLERQQAYTNERQAQIMYQQNEMMYQQSELSSQIQSVAAGQQALIEEAQALKLQNKN